LGGITYGRTTEAFELPRPDFEKDVGGRTAIEALKKQKEEANGHQAENGSGGEPPRYADIPLEM
jgi:hypothetical protein